MRLLVLLMIAMAAAAPQDVRLDDEQRYLFGPYGIASQGADLLRAGRFEEARTALRSTVAENDSAFHLFKLGLAHAGDGYGSDALTYLQRAAAADPALAPVAYEKIGDVEYEGGRYVNALQAYRTAADCALNQRHQFYLYEKMQSVAGRHRDSIGILPWLDELLAFPQDEAAPVWPDSLHAALERGDWDAVDSITLLYVDSTTFRAGTCVACSLLSSWEPLPETLFSTPTLYRLMVVTKKCGRYAPASEWLHRALKRPDFDKVVTKGKYYYDRAILNYELGNYNKAIRWFAKYEELHGPTPELVYLVARSYRSLGMGGKATAWYDKHVKLYPRHPKTQDIIWYRAWQMEGTENWAEARCLYRTLFSSDRKASKADEAYLRYGLSYYRQGLYDSAETAFAAMVGKYPSSSLTSGALYWKACSRYATDNKDGARAAFREVIAYDPLDYYAYRAEKMLAVLGDTTTLLLVDPAFDLAATLAWLDSISTKTRRALSPADSIACMLGRKLTFVGLTRQAEFLLEPIEVSYPGNLRLQFELSVLYRMCNDPGLSYRVGRRLAWRIPAEHRAAMPSPIFHILYPFAYAAIVEKAAADNEISPAVVWAVMRQESIFDHLIVSPVGAVGLMQIMPYTGEEIARDLGEQFVLDSLYSPAVNIRYGTYYIKKLLDSFSGETFKALAGYNGGPHNVRRWFPRRDSRSFDLLVEDVGFSETRTYVKKVLANYWTYQRLLKTESDQSVLERLESGGAAAPTLPPAAEAPGDSATSRRD